MPTPMPAEVAQLEIDPVLEPLNLNSEIKTLTQRLLSRVAPSFGLHVVVGSPLTVQSAVNRARIYVRANCSLAVHREWFQRGKFRSLSAQYETNVLTLGNYKNGIAQTVARACELAHGSSVEHEDNNESWFE